MDKYKEIITNGVWKSTISFIYPPRCVSCAVRVSEPDALCSDCWLGLEIAEIEPSNSSANRCDSWGSFNLNDPTLERYQGCVDGFYYTAPYRGIIRELILSLKFKREYAHANLCAKFLWQVVKGQQDFFDLIIPVPIHWFRRLQRGYNQSELIASKLSAISGVSTDFNALSKIRRTSSQVGKDRKERLVNLLHAFQAKSNKITKKNILLVDDVLTTGATVISCAQVLKDAGCRVCMVATVAAVID